MFGHRYYGVRYYAPRYFGDGGSLPPALAESTSRMMMGYGLSWFIVAVLNGQSIIETALE